MISPFPLESPQHAFKTLQLPELGKPPSEAASPRDPAKRFVGTPDYLAPESILGIGIDDMAVDWWALGVILYEFFYGYPPFHEETVDKVFDNILSRRIEWHEDVMDISPEARDLMEKLMCSDPKSRLGSKGAEEVKSHPFFQGIDWDNLFNADGPFVPQVTNPESTDYFDLRGAVAQNFDGDDSRGNTRDFAKAIEESATRGARPGARPGGETEHTSDPSITDDFGSFRFKNLPVLKQANDEVLRKMRGDQLPPLAQTLEQPLIHARHRSLSGRAGRTGRLSLAGPPSPATSLSSQSSTPSRSTAPTSPPGMAPVVNAATGGNTKGKLEHRPSSLSVTSSSPSGANAQSPSAWVAAGQLPRRSLAEQSTPDSEASGSLSARFRALSLSNPNDRPSLPTGWNGAKRGSDPDQPTSGSLASAAHLRSQGETMKPSASVMSDLRIGAAEAGSEAMSAASDDDDSGSSSSVEKVECLIAEDNPIALKMLENILTKLGCTCTCVRNGADAVSTAMSDVKFAVIFLDVTLPIGELKKCCICFQSDTNHDLLSTVDGEDVARMVKSTRNVNSTTPIVALASFDRGEQPYLDARNSVFDELLAKPLEKADVLKMLPKLGLRTIEEDGGGAQEQNLNQRRGSSSQQQSPTGPDEKEEEQQQPQQERRRKMSLGEALGIDTGEKHTARRAEGTKQQLEEREHEDVETQHGQRPAREA